jgi:ribonucleoside-diphosphate reductase alpha chain
MKINKIKRNITKEHTWDISTDTEQYALSNGCISHNTSAQISNSTNGIEPPRGFISYKQSKDGVMAQVVPGYHKLKNKYDLLWDQEDPTGYLEICAVLQKWIDQGISVNTSYNPAKFPDGKVPMSRLIKDIVTFYKHGGKQLYYNNTFDGAGEIDTGDDDCPDGACKI